MSRQGTAEEKTANSDPIYRNRLGNMLVNRILKHGKKSLAYQIIYRAMFPKVGSLFVYVVPCSFLHIC